MNKRLALVMAASFAVVLPLTVMLVNLAAANFLPPDDPIVTIRSNGTFDPANAPINRTRNIYTLTSSIGYRLHIQCDNIIVDGAGYSVNANPLYSGIKIEAKRVTAKGFNGSPDISITGSFNTITETNISHSSLVGDYNIVIGNKLGSINVKGNYNNITRNIAKNFHLGSGHSNIITENFISGFFTLNEPASFNTFVGNTIKPDGEGTYYVQLNEESNTFYLNNFINIHGIRFYGVNVFDDGSVGNYWSDYNGTDANHDGIGDTPYMIGENVTDRYPLMMEYDAAMQPVIQIISPENKAYDTTSVDLVFSTNKPALRLTYGLDGGDNVTVAGNTTLADLSEGLHTMAVYADDAYFENMGASETVTFSVDFPSPEPFPAALVAGVAGASAVFVIAGLLVYFRKLRH